MMKKYFSNIFACAALLMAGAAFTACSSDDSSIEQPANPAGEKTYTLTVNASKGANASTRALALDGAKLVAKWAEGDELSVFKAENRTGCIPANLLGTISVVAGSISADGKSATFTGNLTGSVVDGDKLMLVYHYNAFSVDAFASQAGTLASASALDCATAQVTASVSGSDITISETSATFTTHTAMLKLTLTKDGTTTINPTALEMSMSAGPLTLKEFSFAPTAATYTANGNGVLYFALPSAADVAAGLSTTTDALSVVTITYAATVGSDVYTATKTGYTFAAGKYYAGTLTMAASDTPLDNTTTAWTAGTFAVPAGGLTYGDAITVSGEVTLILTEGTTLTLNKGISIASGATLTVEGNGTMAVNGTNNSTASTVAGSTGTLILTSGTLTATGGNGAGVGDMSMNTDNRANAGGNAINGNVTVSGGTLTAIGGNGGGVGEMSAYSYGAVGGVAISGSVTVTGGAVTATGGNGGSIGEMGAREYGGAGGAAIGGDATISGGTWTASYGTHGVNGYGQGGDGGKAVAGTVTDNR